MEIALILILVISVAHQMSAENVTYDNLNFTKWDLTLDFNKMDDIRWLKGYESLTEKFLSDMLQTRVGIWKSDSLDNMNCYGWNGVKRLWLEVTDDAVVSMYLENSTGKFINCNHSGKFFFSDMSIFFGEKSSGILLHYGILDDYMYVLLSPHKFQKKVVFRRIKQELSVGLIPVQSNKTHRYVKEDICGIKEYYDNNLYSEIAGFYGSQNMSPAEISHGVTQKFLSINRNGVMQDIYLIGGKYCFMERESQIEKFRLRYNFLGIPAIDNGRLSFVHTPPRMGDSGIIKAKIAGLKGATELQNDCYNWQSNSLFHARERAKNWINEPNVVYTLTTNMVFNKDDMEIMRGWERLEADNELKEIYLKKIIVN